MSKQSHTPGPWVAEKADLYGEDPNRWAVLARDPITNRAYFIATIENGQPGDCLETEEATARLIASAPDLLEALREITTLVSVLHGRGPNAEIPEALLTPLGVYIKAAEIMRNAKAAIQKAQGE